MDGLRYSPHEPYYRLGPVHTCLYVRVRETGALSRVMRAAVPIPPVAAASVSHSAVVGGSVVGVVGLL